MTNPVHGPAVVDAVVVEPVVPVVVLLTVVVLLVPVVVLVSVVVLVVLVLVLVLVVVDVVLVVDGVVVLLVVLVVDGVVVLVVVVVVVVQLVGETVKLDGTNPAKYASVRPQVLQSPGRLSPVAHVFVRFAVNVETQSGGALRL